MYKRDFIIQNNLFFYEGILDESKLYSIQSFLLAKRVLYIPKKLCLRRIRDNYIVVSDNCKKRLEDTESILREMCRFYINNKDLFKSDVADNIKNHIKFMFNKAIMLCERGNLIDDKNRIIKKFKIGDEIILKELEFEEKISYKEYNKKNILFVMYLLSDGGAEKALMSILDNLDYSKYNVDLVVLAKEKSYLYNINENVNVVYMYDTVDEMYKEYLS